MVTQVREGIWRIEGSTSNCYVCDADELVLVDAGTPGDAEAIRGALYQVGHDVADVDRVLVTHYDYDHVGALSKLTPALDAPVVAAEPDASIVAGERKPPLTNHKGLLQRVAGLGLDLPDLPVERVTDGEVVSGFTAYHTPGHSPGHLAFVDPDRSVGMLGDLVREKNGALQASPWVMSYDTGAVSESIRSLAERAPDFEAACPGHGNPLASSGSVALSRLAREV